MGFPGTGNIGPKTAGNREHQPQNSREQGTFMKSSGTREHTAGTTEHWLENSREQGTLAQKVPGTGNISLQTAGSRERSTKRSVGITNPCMKERYMRYYVKFGCLWLRVQTAMNCYFVLLSL